MDQFVHVGATLTGFARADYQASMEDFSRFQDPVRAGYDHLLWTDVQGLADDEPQQRMSQMVQALQAITKQHGFTDEWYQQTVHEIAKRMPGFDASQALLQAQVPEHITPVARNAADPRGSADLHGSADPRAGRTRASPRSVSAERLEELNQYIRQQAQEYVESQAEWSRQLAEVRSEGLREAEKLRREKAELEQQARRELGRLKQVISDLGGECPEENSWALSMVAPEEYQALQKRCASAEERVQELEQYIKAARPEEEGKWGVEEELRKAKAFQKEQERENQELKALCMHHHQKVLFWEAGAHHLVDMTTQFLSRTKEPSEGLQRSACQDAAVATGLAVPAGSTGLAPEVTDSEGDVQLETAQDIDESSSGTCLVQPAAKAAHFITEVFLELKQMLRTSLSDNRTEVTERPRRKEVSTKERCFPVGAVLFLACEAIQQILEDLGPTRRAAAERLVAAEKALRSLDRELRSCQEIFGSELSQEEVSRNLPLDEESQLRCLTAMWQAKLSSSQALSEFVLLPQHLKLMFKAFADAKDRWKIDGNTMKGYYLHSESGYLYIWHQATGVLYEHLQSSGQCQAVWSSAVPQLNAEIWTVLPLPPTDPASMQASSVSNGELPNIDVFINLTVAHEADKQIPADLLQAALEGFSLRWELRPQETKKITRLPPAGQCYALQNFRGPKDEGSMAEALDEFLAELKRQYPPPWGSSACTLRVESTGAIIGRCCPDLDALCRDDPPERLAQAHCKIRSEKDRFFLCDMETSEEGTTLDGYAVNGQWVGPLKTGSLIVCGPLRIKIQLSEMAKDTPLDASAMRQMSLKRSFGESDDEEDPAWRRKVFQRSEEDCQLEWRRRQEQYKDRAQERRQRHSNSGAAIDTLVNKFEKIVEAERMAAEVEAQRVEMPTQEDQREACMNVDGTFVGGEKLERAGIGFHSSASAELIPNVLDPKSLSRQDTAKIKMQMRFKQAHE
ncbi:unnamed protein product [Durusdinium trenchii]|uniref:FHA domain-containing protein n=1 Tax=Durusdinium trenchii TaxID=1381693 RepID=A0ABP0NUB2_9DINO